MGRVFFAAVIIGGLVLSSISLGYPGGSGTAEDPYQIADVNDLLALAGTTADYSKCFVLTADINMGGEVFTTAIIASGDVFTGTFDGNSHKITNFTINGGSNPYLGLFGYIYPGGSVKNLGLENCTVSGDSSSDDVGTLVGYNYGGSISDCYSTGSVSGYNGVGGLVGYNVYGANISNCYSTGAVSGTSGSWYVGGLVGYNYYSSIGDCYSTGTVSGSYDSYMVGGLAGYNYGSISDCYSTGPVSGYCEVGGLVGHNYGSISNCYSTGSVSGTTDIGGLVGYNYGSIGGCYFLKTSGPANGYGEPLTDEEMKQQSHFVGWDFVDETANGTDDIWRMCIDGVYYPLLWWQFNTADFTCPDGVDFIDFATLANAWLSDPMQVNWNGRCDISEPSDNVIDILDLAIFTQHWLE